ncbi:MAG TPA: DsbA family protein [Panacibacter sp.]|nr:DsbA family protein [Panacibacter sp.]
MKPLLIYCYDAYCGWCYGFSPVIKKIAETFKDRLDFEVLSGGMIITEKPVAIAATATYIQSAYKRVEEYSGITFGKDYLWHIFNPEESDWFPSSEKPSIALCIFKELHAGNPVEFAADMQYALHYEGRDLTDDEAYRHLLDKYKINVDTFYKLLKSETFKEKAYYEFSLVKQLKVQGFPAVFIQGSELKFYLVAQGFTDYETVNQHIENVLKEIGA